MAVMAAHPSSEGGHPSMIPALRSKSFSELFSPQQRTQVSAAHSTHHGELAVSFPHDAIEAAVQPFRDALVGKFSRGRPRMEDIRKFFYSLDLKDTFTVGLMDARHVLIQLHNEADFLRVWTRNI